MSRAETKLRILVSNLDLPALEALASKGLVRRARKDLERGVPVRIDREEDGGLVITAGEFEVTIPEAGPARARCSCASTVVCQHILAAVLFLQREPAAGAAGGRTEGAAGGRTAEGVAGGRAAEGAAGRRTAEEEMLSFTREQLESWAGKATFRAALELASQSPVEAAAERALVIRLPAVNVECHYAPGAGLDGIIVTGNAKDAKRLAAAAVIAFQRSRGVAWEIPVTRQAALEESAGAPRSRGEVIESTQQLFGELLADGLARLSSSAQQRLATLAVSALGVNLPRLSLALRGLSKECALTMGRDANSDPGRMLAAMAQTSALCAALERGGAPPRPDLVGWLRTQYDNLGNLDLTGVSAWPWRTPSGYTGLTLLFWDAAGKRWNSWTESRPVQQQLGFQPVARYRQPGPWEGAESPRELSRSTFRLMNARRNPGDRLSGSGKSRVLITGIAKIADQGAPIFCDWAQLWQVFDARHAAGLREPNPLDSVFAVNPAGWGQRFFDPVAQLFSWPMLDPKGRVMAIQIGFDVLSEPAIRYLETAAADWLEGAVVVGRVQKSPGMLSMRAYSLHGKDGEIHHLFLDTAGAIAAQTATAGEDDDGPEEQEAYEPGAVSSPVIQGLLDEVDDALLMAVEAGIASLNAARVERLGAIAAGLERIELRSLSTALRVLAARRQASMILRCAYLSQLHRRAIRG